MHEDTQLIWEAYITEKKSSFEVLQKNKIPLTDEERKIALDADCTWNFSHLDKPSCAVWKGKDSSGQIWYVVHTHRAYQASKTLKGILGSKWKFIQSTA